MFFFLFISNDEVLWGSLFSFQLSSECVLNMALCAFWFWILSLSDKVNNSLACRTIASGNEIKCSSMEGR